MTDKIKDDAPAFPVCAGQQVYATGMTLRDWFAGQALTGYIAHLGAQDIHAGSYTDECAEEAYRIADAMIAARASRNGGDQS